MPVDVSKPLPSSDIEDGSQVDYKTTKTPGSGSVLNTETIDTDPDTIKNQRPLAANYGASSSKISPAILDGAHMTSILPASEGYVSSPSSDTDDGSQVDDKTTKTSCSGSVWKTVTIVTEADPIKNQRPLAANYCASPCKISPAIGDGAHRTSILSAPDGNGSSPSSDTDEESFETRGEYKSIGPEIKAMEDLSYERKHLKDLREMLIDCCNSEKSRDALQKDFDNSDKCLYISQVSDVRSPFQLFKLHKQRKAVALFPDKELSDLDEIFENNFEKLPVKQKEWYNDISKADRLRYIKETKTKSASGVSSSLGKKQIILGNDQQSSIEIVGECDDDVHIDENQSNKQEDNDTKSTCAKGEIIVSFQNYLKICILICHKLL